MSALRIYMKVDGIKDVNTDGRTLAKEMTLRRSPIGPGTVKTITKETD